MVHGILQFTYYYNQPFQRAKFIDKSRVLTHSLTYLLTHLTTYSLKVGSYSYNVGAFIGSCMYSLYQVLLLPYLVVLDLVHTPNSDLLIATNNFTSYLSIRRPLGTAIMLLRVLILGHLPCLRNTIYHIDSETSYITRWYSLTYSLAYSLAYSLTYSLTYVGTMIWHLFSKLYR